MTIYYVWTDMYGYVSIALYDPSQYIYTTKTVAALHLITQDFAMAKRAVRALRIKEMQEN